MIFFDIVFFDEIATFVSDGVTLMVALFNVEVKLLLYLANTLMLLGLF